MSEQTKKYHQVSIYFSLVSVQTRGRIFGSSVTLPVTFSSLNNLFLSTGCPKIEIK